MKKTLSMALIAALGLGMTSCLGSEDDEITRASLQMYNFTENLDDPKETPVLTMGNTSFEVNHTQRNINMTVQGSVMDGLPVSFTTGVLPMTATNNSYVYSAKSIMSTGIAVSSFEGAYEPNVGMVFNEYIVSGSYKVHSTASYAYNFSVMNVYDAPGGKLLYQSDKIAFGFIPACDKAMTTKMVVSGFALSDGGDIMPTLTYETSSEKGKETEKSLHYSMTKDGFKVEGLATACSQGYATYNITNVKGEVSEYGKFGKVSYSLNNGKQDYYVEIQGTMFFVPVN